MKYQVIGQAVEINGKKYDVGDVVDESNFRSLETVEAEAVVVEQPVEEAKVETPEPAVILSEADSLLKSGHIIKVEE